MFAFAALARVRHLVTFHHDPGHSDDEIDRLTAAAVHAVRPAFQVTAGAAQPPIPGTVLLFTSERLTFRGNGEAGAGILNEPSSKYLIIDGQHRLAALNFYLHERPDDAATINVPCIIFDARSEDFATEMFVIINSTPTRINKSHLIDLYERVTWASPATDVVNACGP